MDGIQAMKDLLAAFGASIGVPTLAPDEDGYACLEMDGDLVVHVAYDEESESLRLFGELGPVSPDQELRVMRELLDANVLWRGTGGAILGLDSSRKVVTLAYREPIGMLSSVRFEQLLGAFVEVADAWGRRLAAPAVEADAPHFPDFPPGFLGLRA